MTLLWLIIWLLAGTPSVHQWNGWLISLIVAVISDVFTGGSR